MAEIAIRHILSIPLGLSRPWKRNTQPPAGWVKCPPHHCRAERSGVLHRREASPHYVGGDPSRVRLRFAQDLGSEPALSETMG